VLWGQRTGSLLKLAVAENDWEDFGSSLSALAVRNTKLNVLSLLTEPCV